MAAARASAPEARIRAQKLARILAKGGTYSDCRNYAADQWDISERQIKRYVAAARLILRQEWDEIEREQMVAEILSQYSSLQLEARASGQLHVALGCIHGAARVAQLVL